MLGERGGEKQHTKALPVRVKDTTSEATASNTVTVAAVLYRHVLCNCCCLSTSAAITNQLQALAAGASHRMRSILCWLPPSASGCRCEHRAQTLRLTHAGRRAGGRQVGGRAAIVTMVGCYYGCRRRALQRDAASKFDSSPPSCQKGVCLGRLGSSDRPKETPRLALPASSVASILQADRSYSDPRAAGVMSNRQERVNVPQYNQADINKFVCHVCVT